MNTIKGNNIKLEGTRSDGADHTRAQFEEFCNEDEYTPTSDVIEFYYAQVSECTLMDTCMVLGIITGCLKDDDYEEADQVARLYMKFAQKRKNADWENKQFTDSGPKDEYPTNSHAFTMCEMLNVLLSNLKGDAPDIELCIILCDSMYAECLEIESLGEPVFEHIVPDDCEEYISVTLPQDIKDL